MKSKAAQASFEVFTINLKQLLLITPVKGRPILGIDPGFKYGCKIALISETGTPLATDIIYPHSRKGSADVDTIKELLHTHKYHY